MKRLILVVVILVAPLLRAQEADLINPDRPGIADGSATVRRGVFQVELGGELDDDSGSHTLSTPLLLRYGLTDALELRVETAGFGRVSESGRTKTGFNPTSLGLKYHFHDAPSLGVIARFFPPSGTGVFHNDNSSGDVRLAADINLGEKWAINPNVGIASENVGSCRTTTGLAALTVQRNLTEKANVFVDGAADSSSLVFDAGAAWILGRDLQLDVSVGWGAHGDAPDIFWSAGVSRRF